ncbi:MAG: hypothetical protein OSJ62_07490 [Lachnospiraceae bacterium]|nr:hypothetical protein [Lachnospiraceae bacterium]
MSSRICIEKEIKEGREMVIIVIGVSIMCGIGWLTCWVGSAALVRYMMDKGYMLPSEEEMQAYSKYVWEKLLHIK